MWLRFQQATKAIVLFLVACHCSIALPASAASPADAGEFVAYVDRAMPERTQLADVVKVRRQGQWQSIAKDRYGLKAGDELFVTQPGTVIIIRILATNERIPVRQSADAAGAHSSPDWTVPAGAGLPGAVADWFWHFVQGAERTEGQTQIAASRGTGHTSQPAAGRSGACYNETGKSDEPVQFRVPIRTATGSTIVGGNRAIFVSWQGGAQPFSVALSRAETGQTVAETNGVRGVCAVYLPRAVLTQGTYRLTVTDGNHVKEQQAVAVVADLPGAPVELRQANVPEEARQLYTATWLSLLDGGKWALEAQQQVAAMDCRSATVQDWLRRWGGLAPCGGPGH